MADHPAEKKSRRKQSSTPDEAQETARIRKSMSKWQSMDAPARLLGRGLGRRELERRVASEVGITLRQVQVALR
ncbi:MAG: hypothetical protein AUJ52_10170 [Elusimicrobia bacterium CG1_02_63_36]|nr:MAG: hypothetical protein AUJ52_10170 [Elusimicrobia bacterium CG1_02_63_36]PIP82764.1 MAG: hypothetical protein COR54_13120 [Elusimicrobia bacterium CG22_combo_CG10-13_8_21_14_all_63_91]PJA12451.1 MAG: hypothetical protein COX66_17395 [Elusimicrobia bacterium CG_4_10_14_0_2_um_filter_63_34]PJB26462.1 MAG: hypothetical protein CO113_03435 [Elusimicrobia bacterium CG_4_9_14_3_um_filter_62_55]